MHASGIFTHTSCTLLNTNTHISVFICTHIYGGIPVHLHICTHTNQHIYQNVISQAWWHVPIIPAIGRLRQKDCEFEANLGSTARPCLKNKIKCCLYNTDAYDRACQHTHRLCVHTHWCLCLRVYVCMHTPIWACTRTGNKGLHFGPLISAL
jgi:hypothetical protein